MVPGAGLNWLAVVAMLATIMLAVPDVARADGTWIDGPLTNWNLPDTTVPGAPPPPAGYVPDPRCLLQTRVAETIEDVQVSRAGWLLYGSYQGGWGARVVVGAVAFDGMCRPLSYQFFAFSYGVYAGTFSPVLMNSRTDGALDRLFFSGPLSDSGPLALPATFRRYGATDPLCCPSATSQVTYHLTLEGGRPLLIPVGASTAPN